MGIASCRLVDLRTISDERGSLTAIEAGGDVCFEIKSVFFLHHLPSGSCRGGHSHRQLEELVIATAGSFDVLLDDGQETRTVHLSDPSRGLYVHPTVWRELRNFSTEAVCLALASRHYDESDYIRDYGLFKSTVMPDAGSVAGDPDPIGLTNELHTARDSRESSNPERDRNR